MYAALTTTSGHAGMRVVLIGAGSETRAQVEDAARRQIAGAQWDQPKDIYVDTESKNLFVLSLSEAKSRYPRAVEAYWDGIAQERDDMLDELGI